MDDRFQKRLQQELKLIRESGLYKEERVITSPQQPEITVNGKTVINFCANNYLGLANHPAIVESAINAIKTHGYGMASVRFICGTQDLHKQLEQEISTFFGTDDTILYSSCFDANGGLFETLLSADDAIVSDELNHASIIDGIRLCKAKRYRYKNNDMADLEMQLHTAKAAGAHNIMIATDGVFSMDGTIANLKEICRIADQYHALVMVDDSHASGFMGKTGRGTPEMHGVEKRIDVMTSTLGKALGGASGGFTTGRKEIIELLRQRSRPYLFSNTIAPVVAAASCAVLKLLEGSTQLRDTLEQNTSYFRESMTAAGFTIKPGVHPICPIMLGDAKLAVTMAKDLLAEGVYVIGFCYPVVPKDQARIRVQISAAHTREQIDRAVTAFRKIGKKHNVVS